MSPLTRPPRRRPPGLADDQLGVAWQSLSLLFGYPDEALLAALPTVRAASYQLPAAVGEPVRKVVVHLESTPLEVLQADYVDTFDRRRRCNLFLTYFAHGDTRKRGLALLRFKQTYLRSGFVLDADAEHGGELPDHLCVVLEFGATVDRQQGWRLLTDHRAGVELLRMSLRDCGSPWAPLAEALSATLSPLGGEERDAVRGLAAEGPPEEEVGLDPYAGPSFDPALDNPALPGPQELGLPSFPGVR